MDGLARVLDERGAALVAYGDLTGLPSDVREGLPRGISIAVALNPRIIAGISAGPTREYHAEYGRANALLNDLGAAAAAFLQERGHRAVAQAATIAALDPATYSTRLPHKTVATRCGVGWIGRCALLVTKEYGSAIRITSVLTDAPLPVLKAVDESQCGDCMACVEACPGHAPSGRTWRAGLARGELFDAFACRRTAVQQAGRIGVSETICGRCISVCPWTRQYLKRAWG
jgi:epoxyqueuosine reductase QueG